MTDRTSVLLEKAFLEARRAGWLWTAPNPRVGALALRQGQIVGRGFHAEWGQAHAEEQALRDAGAWDETAQQARSGRVDEMVVTLEPCSSSGSNKKRTPCTRHLLDAGVSKLTVGALDPDPRHQGAGLDFLRKQGLTDIHLAETASHFSADNGAFLASLSQSDRPWTLAKWAASLDGKMASSSGVSQWITSSAARLEGHALRASVDAVLAGPETIARDDPALSARPRGDDSGHQPLRIALARTLPGPNSTLMTTSSPLLLVLPEELAHHGSGRAKQVEILAQPVDSNGRFLLDSLWRKLAADYGVRRLLVEGGSRLQGALLGQGLLDALVSYQAPLLLGGSRAAMDGPGFPGPQEAPILVDEERKDLPPDLRRAFRLSPAVSC